MVEPVLVRGDLHDQSLFVMVSVFLQRTKGSFFLLHVKGDRYRACVDDSKGVIFTSPKTINSTGIYPLLKIFEPYIEELKPKKGNPGMVFKGRQANALVQGQSSVRRKAAFSLSRGNRQKRALNGTNFANRRFCPL